MKKVLLALSFVVVCGLSALTAQTRTITGTVTGSDDGMPIPGASVFVKGTTMGTVTQINGSYSLNVPADAQTLVFSFVGMQTQEQPVAGRSVIDVILSSDAIAMDEVIVVAYGTSTRASFTGSASSVSASDLLNSRTESVDKALAGKVSGVRVTSVTGDPGSGGDMQIRGIGSITGNTSPLYIVDGIPIVTGNFSGTRNSSDVLASINPDDIESMTVLKDAAAASLYGSRAANGVVIITTKKGKKGDTKFNFRSNIGWSEMATNSYEMMSGVEYTQYHLASLEGYRLNQLSGLHPGQANYQDPATQAAAREWALARVFDPGWSWVEEEVNGADWRNLIYDGGSDQDYQFSASGGNESTNFYTSVGYRKVEGLVRNREFERYTGTLNLDNQARNWLNLAFKTQMSYTNQLGRGDQSDQEQGIATSSPLNILYSANPTKKAFDENGNYIEEAAFTSRYDNPLQALSREQAFVENKTYRAINNAAISVQLLPQLSFRSTNALDFIMARHFNYWGPSSIDGASLNGLGEKLDNEVISLTTSNVFNYSINIDNEHKIDALVGFEAQKYINNYQFASASDYSTDKLRELGNAQPRNVSSLFYKRFMQSFFGNVNYNYADRYYLGGSLRSDESSQLGKDNRRGLFYSISGSWRFTQEEFFSSNLISDGKLRASYGTNGNLPTGSYAHLGLYYFGSEYAGNPAIYMNQIENADLGWEKSRNVNFGFDLSFLNKVSLSAEYFYKYTTDLLLSMPASYLTGVSSSMQNAGEISNKGIDVELKAFDILSSPLKWDLSLALSTLKATVEKLPNGEDIILGDGNLYLYREGSDLYTFYLPTYHGVDPENGLAQFLIDPSLPADASNLTYVHSQAQRGPQGSSYPTLMGGFGNTFSWKGLSFNVLMTYQFGGQLFDYPGYFSHHDGVRNFSFNLAKDVAGNYWTKPGDVVDNPRPVLSNALRPDLWSTRHLHSTDFIRLKEVSLNYNLPREWYRSIGVDHVAVNFTANNLPYIYAATKDMELEVALNGYRTVDTPLARTFTFGVNVQF